MFDICDDLVHVAMDRSVDLGRGALHGVAALNAVLSEYVELNTAAGFLDPELIDDARRIYKQIRSEIGNKAGIQDNGGEILLAGTADEMIEKAKEAKVVDRDS